MKHIINKLLLIGEIDLIKDILYVFKVTYIMFSAVVILPPTVEEWNKNKIDIYGKSLVSYTDLYGNTFYKMGQCNETWSMRIIPIIEPSNDLRYIDYSIGESVKIYINVKQSNMNCDNLWYDKKGFSDFCCNKIVPIYYFPVN